MAGVFKQKYTKIVNGNKIKRPLLTSADLEVCRGHSRMITYYRPFVSEVKKK
jgi:hypothetical protein